jgi:hypothetical protein
MDPPAENNAISMLSKDVSVNSSVVYVSPSNSTSFPALLEDASIFISLYGKSLCFKTLKNSCPTAPVTPAMHTLGPSGVFFANVCTTFLLDPLLTRLFCFVFFKDETDVLAAVFREAPTLNIFF